MREKCFNNTMEKLLERLIAEQKEMEEYLNLRGKDECASGEECVASAYEDYRRDCEGNCS